MGSVEMRNRGRKEEVMEEEELEENYTHMCKICKKKFVSGRAFGGHMRIHGPVAMAAAAESNERKRSRAEIRTRDVQEEEGGVGEFDAGYELRRHPRPSWRLDRDYSFLAVGGGGGSGGGGHGFESRPTRMRSCEACGKEFDSWKSLLSHMKCHEENLEYPEAESTDPEEEEGGGSETESESEQHGQRMENSGWMKGKRSKRPRNLQVESNNNRPSHVENCNSNSVSEEEDMAICLVMLASGVDTKKPNKAGGGGGGVGQEESANSGSQRPRKMESGIGSDDQAKKLKYVCTTCNKTFHSYQALGGHRASHKKIKGCSSRFDENEVENENEHEIESLEEDVTDEEPEKPKQEGAAAAKAATTIDETAPAPVVPISVSAAPLPPGKKNISSSKIHECSICHRVFSTGQALGGHKRCHWGTGGNSETTSTVSSTKESPPKSRRPELLDLNLPAFADEDDDCIQETSNNKLASLGVDYSQKPAVAASDVESHSKISVPLFQSWWTDHLHHPKQQGHFLYNGHQRTHLPHEDEVDSKLGSKIAFGRAQEKYFPNRPQPWLQL